ncbi:MAG: SGNH/GDSL hydrolase family protein [Candidatus Gottesmanbacteria bacterium]|nr:SGNH/GDSL hydrolase family protein [Candidatus Gottesmanbacteria bacterium]
MSLLSLFAFAVFAAETVISPIPDDMTIATSPPPKPDVTFGQIISAPGTTPEVLAITTVAPTPTPIATKKKSYTIVLLGDSMIDTLGPGIPALHARLKNIYPGANFTLLNYGDGGTNIDYGIERITNSYTYVGNQIPALTATNPDIVVLESFAYNPFPEANGLDRHWMAMARAVDTIHQYLPGAKIIIAATIAPNSTVFGDGAAGLAFSAQDKIERTTVIKQYLDSTVKFAASQHLPLADAYHASLTATGDGILTYINGGDHIHYSDAGRALFTQAVMDAIRTNHLLE